MFMIHENHGAANVPDGEVEAHEKLGWKKATHDDWFRMSGKPYLCQVSNTDEPKKKAGRPRKTD